MRDDFEKFCKEFDIVDNALKQRQLIRWNGRDLRKRENLAEHSHLVVACVIEIVELLDKQGITGYNPFKVVKLAMLHDGLELLRGDILSVTKDVIPGLRHEVDKEEEEFMRRMVGDILPIESWILKLADLKACYKFVESELRFPNNDFAKEVYADTKAKYEREWNAFCALYGLITYKQLPTSKQRFSKGYKDDAGIDIILDRKVVFMPMSTQSIELAVNFTPSEGKMGLLCARTSAAIKGLTVAMCPIDPNYTGEVIAIVSNVSNEIITYDKGESFCQLIEVPFVNHEEFPARKQGKRSDGKLGSTGV